MTTLTDDQREVAILQASQDSMAAQGRGDMVAARQHLDRMTALVRSRSPERVAAMEAEYFGWRGEQDQMAIARKAMA